MAEKDNTPFRTKDVSPRGGEIVKPHELIGIAGHESWTLAERRAWNLLLVNAWGEDLDRYGAVFSMELRELRGLHDSNDRLFPSYSVKPGPLRSGPFIALSACRNRSSKRFSSAIASASEWLDRSSFHPGK